MLRSLLGRFANDLAFQSLPLISWATTTRKILLDTRQPQLCKSTSPAPNRVGFDTYLAGDLVVRHAICGQQNHAGSFSLSHRNPAAFGPPVKGCPFSLIENDLLCYTHNQYLHCNSTMEA